MSVVSLLVRVYVVVQKSCSVGSSDKMLKNEKALNKNNVSRRDIRRAIACKQLISEGAENFFEPSDRFFRIILNLRDRTL